MARPRTPSSIATGALGTVALLSLTLTLAGPARAGVGDGQLDPVVAEKAALADVGVGAGEVRPDGSFRVATNGCPDGDGDGVCDQSPADDQCLGTAANDPVDTDGCSIDQLCPCNGPKDGGDWKNHGAYVSCVSHAANHFAKQGWISNKEKGKIKSAAAESDCGKVAFDCVASGGVEVGGFCWFASATGGSCSTACADAGLSYDEATRDYAGSAGTNAGCLGVLEALGAGSGVVADVPSVVDSLGCSWSVPTGNRGRFVSPPTTAGASGILIARGCACQ